MHEAIKELVCRPIPAITQAHCLICHDTTEFQLQIEIINSTNSEEGFTVSADVYWFCTECHEQTLPCDTVIAWSN
jgi:hypothetical protein